MMDQGNRWRGVFNDYSNPSFMDLLRREAPHLMPSASPAPQEVPHEPPHGTTVLSVRYRDGVIMAGDRQATAGFQVASRRIEKIFKADELSGVGIAGAAGPATEMAKLFQTELEHYEKVEGENLSLEPPHGTTVLSVRYRDGVIMAGDGQATAGFQVASRRIEKIFKADELSGVGIAGAAGPATEMAKLFQTELEHYEKVEGENLSLEGKANRLSQMIRMNLPAAMQGLIVVPIFAGYDEKAGVGRLFKYDITGGRYEETNYDAQGSGANYARDSLKKLWKRDMARDDALRVALEALFDAADEDVGTGGADLVRGIFPSVKMITRSGFAEVPEDEVRRVCEAVLADRARNATGS